MADGERVAIWSEHHTLQFIVACASERPHPERITAWRQRCEKRIGVSVGRDRTDAEVDGARSWRESRTELSGDDERAVGTHRDRAALLVAEATEGECGADGAGRAGELNDEEIVLSLADELAEGKLEFACIGTDRPDVAVAIEGESAQVRVVTGELHLPMWFAVLARHTNCESRRAGKTRSEQIAVRGEAQRKECVGLSAAKRACPFQLTLRVEAQYESLPQRARLQRVSSRAVAERSAAKPPCDREASARIGRDGVDSALSAAAESRWRTDDRSRWP